MVYFSKIVRNAIVWVRWGNGDLLVVSQHGELVAKYAYAFEAGLKYLGLKKALIKFQNGSIDE